MTKEGGKLTDSAADNLTCLAFCAAKFELRTMHRGKLRSVELFAKRLCYCSKNECIRGVMIPNVCIRFWIRSWNRLQLAVLTVFANFIHEK